MWITPLNYTADDFAEVVSPTLVLIGDRDEITSVAFFSAGVAAFQSLILNFLLRHARPGR